MKSLRLIGFGMFAYGAAMLGLLVTPWEQWALEHSIAHLTSLSDRRLGNTIDGAVDLPLAIAGSAAVMVAGIWFMAVVPAMIGRWQRRLRAGVDLADVLTDVVADVAVSDVSVGEGSGNARAAR